jgi:hypothetical protein
MNNENYIILAAVIILILIVGFLFRKRMKLLIVRMIYGPFSYEYLDIHKRFFIKSPYHYCFRDEFLTHLLNILFQKDGIPEYQSDHNISFDDISQSMSYKKFIQLKGDPYCFNAFKSDQPGFEIKALGYRSLVGGSKAIKVYYFMNDSFFMGEYYFKNPKTDIKAGISKIFLNNVGPAEDSFYIRNSKDRIILYKGSGNKVDIKYLNLESQAIISNLKNYYDLKTGRKPAV